MTSSQNWAPADVRLAVQSTAEWECRCKREAALVARLKTSGADARYEEGRASSVIAMLAC